MSFFTSFGFGVKYRCLCRTSKLFGKLSSFFWGIKWRVEYPHWCPSVKRLTRVLGAKWTVQVPQVWCTSWCNSCSHLQVGDVCLVVALIMIAFNWILAFDGKLDSWNPFLQGIRAVLLWCSNMIGSVNLQSLHTETFLFPIKFMQMLGDISCLFGLVHGMGFSVWIWIPWQPNQRPCNCW